MEVLQEKMCPGWGLSLLLGLTVSGENFLIFKSYFSNRCWKRRAHLIIGFVLYSDQSSILKENAKLSFKLTILWITALLTVHNGATLTRAWSGVVGWSSSELLDSTWLSEKKIPVKCLSNSCLLCCVFWILVWLKYHILDIIVGIRVRILWLWEHQKKN